MSTAVEKKARPKVDKTGWSRQEAQPGEELLLVAKLSGFAPGTEVSFKIFPTTGDPGAPIATLKGVSDDQGFAWADWAYTALPGGLRDPRLVFEAEADGSTALSPSLTIVDFLELDLADENAKPLNGKTVHVVDALGQLHTTQTNTNGLARVAKLALGEAMFRVKGYEIEGESRPGEKKFRSGTKHTVSMREMTFTVEFESPKDGDVYLSGDRVPIKTHVRRVGRPWEGVAAVTANNGARIVGGAGQAKDAAKAAQADVLVLPGKDGTVELQAKFESTITTIKVKVVKAYVAEVIFEGDDHFPLFDDKTKAPKAASARWDGEGRLLEQHPGAFRFGKKLKAKARVVTSEELAKPTSIEVALITPAVADDGLSVKGFEKLAGKPLTLRLPEGQRKEGVKLVGGEKGTLVPLESDRPLPNAIGTYKWNVTALLNQNPGTGWTHSDGNLPIWPKVGELKNLRVNAVWGPATVGDGKELEAGAEPLKKSEYSPFHVRTACQWAQGGANLLMKDPRSIPAKVAANARKLQFPDEYNWLNGKPRTEHPRPATEHEVEITSDPTQPGKSPTAKNWGWGVVTGAAPGGASHQFASLYSAVLNTLGVKANVLYLRPRPGGALHLTDFDPITRLSDCFDPKRDWGVPWLAFVGVPVDKSRDGDFQGVKLHEDETFVIEAKSKKAGLQSTAAVATADLKVRDTTRLGPNSRCGHPFKPSSGGFQKKLVRAFAQSRTQPNLDFGTGAGYYVARSLLTQKGFKIQGGIDKITPGTLDGAHLFVITALRAPLAPQEVQLLETFVKEGGAVLDFRNMFMPSIFGVKQKQFVNAAGRSVVNAPPAQGVGAIAYGSRSILTNGNGGAPFMNEQGGASGLYFSQGKGRAVIIGDEQLFMNGFRGMPGAPMINHKENQKLLVSVFEWLAGAPGVPQKANRACAISGSQPTWGYKSAKTGKPVAKDAKKDDAGNSLEGAFVAASIYPSPSTGKTVHDGDAEDWASGEKLTPRKPEERFGQPPAEQKPGGDGKKDEKKDEKKPAGEDAMAQPIGRFDVKGANGRAGVLVLGAQGEPSKYNEAYAHTGVGPAKVDIQGWDAKTNTLSLKRTELNGLSQAAKLTFEPSGAFKGTFGVGPVSGGLRMNNDAVPVPVGLYDLTIGAPAQLFRLRIEGGGSAKALKGDFYNPASRAAPLVLQNAKVDEDVQTLTFDLPGGQKAWITLTQGGRAGKGVFLERGVWKHLELKRK